MVERKSAIIELRKLSYIFKNKFKILLIPFFQITHFIYPENTVNREA